MPERAAVLRLEAHGRRRPRHSVVVVAPLLEIAICCCLAEQPSPQADWTVGRLSAMILEMLIAVAVERCRALPLGVHAFIASPAFPLQPAIEGHPRQAVERRDAG